MHRPVLGVLGGVGPLATAYFMEAVIKKTPAKTDQEHLPIIVFNDPQIPDRTRYILDHTQPSPAPEMLTVAKQLQAAGADFMAIPCNTAHYFYEAISAAVDIPVLNIMEETATRISDAIGAGSTVGLMATEGTLQSNVFQSYFEQRGLNTLAPSDEERQKLMKLIYDGVKGGQPYRPQDLLDIANSLHERGCDAVVVGCTELSVIYQNLPDCPPWLYDSLDILAERCVRYYLDARAEMRLA